MPTIPSYGEQRVQPSVGPQSAFLSDRGNSPDAFGASVGQANAGLGKAVEGVGDQIAQITNKLQADENETTANEAVTNYLIKQSELTENFKLLQGKDPKAAMADYTANLKKLREEMRGGLGNPEVQRMFDRETTRQFGYSVMNAASYSSQQFKVYQNRQADARVSAEVSAAAQASDDSLFGESLKSIEDSIRFTDKGESEEVIQGKIRDKQGQAWNNRLQTVALNDPERARALLNKNRTGIDGIVAQNLENYINQQDVRVTSGRIAQKVALGGPTTTKTEKEDYAMSYLTPKWGKAGAAAIVGGLAVESGLRTDAVNPGDGADGSDSIGLAQWNGPRAKNLKKFAEERNLDWRDFKTQVQFIDHELTTTHRGVGDKLKAAGDVDAAARVGVLNYEVPKGAETGVAENVKSWPQRKAEAERLAGKTVNPVMTVTTGNRGALENEARQEAITYADKNGLDQRSREQLVEASVNRLDTLYSKQQATQRDAAVGSKATLTQFVTNGPDGKNPVTSIDQVMGPEAPAEIRNAYLGLDPVGQKQVRDMLSRNTAASATPAAPTEETRRRRQELEGMRTLDPNAFLSVDPLKEKLTRADLSWLASKQAEMVNKDVSEDAQAANVGWAMQVLQRGQMLDVPGLRKEDIKADPKRFQQFQGALSQQLDRYNLDQQGKRPSEDEVKKMAKDLMVEMTTSPGWFTLPLVGEVGATRQRLYETGKGPNNPPAFVDIPQDEVNKIREAAREAGRPNIRPQEIRMIYQRKLQRGTRPQEAKAE